MAKKECNEPACPCRTDKTIAELKGALRNMLVMFESGHSISRFNWGMSALRAEDIRELNEIPSEARELLRRLR